MFGEQFFYPAYVDADSRLRTLHDVFGVFSENIQESREIIGNETAGYKVAICQRDVAIYGSMIVIALIFQFSHKKIIKLPFWLWFIFAIIPIGIDGFWQLISSSNIDILKVSSHESTPLIRTITGVLFGFFDLVGVLLPRQVVSVSGRSAGGDWVMIDYPGDPGNYAWVYAPFVYLSPGELPIIEPPSTPTPEITQTINPTLAAQFITTPNPTRLPTFTPGDPLVIPTYTDTYGASFLRGVPMGLVIIILGGLGGLLALFSFIRSR